MLHLMGVKPRAVSSTYNFWSGFGSDIGEVVLIGAILGAFKKVNCHTPGCWRFGSHDWPDANGVTHKLCRKHHPQVEQRPTPAVIAEHEQRKATAQQGSSG